MQRFWRKAKGLSPKRAFSSAGSEHLPYKQRVGGSNPSTPTKKAPIEICFSVGVFWLNSPEIFILSPFRIDKNFITKYFVIIPVVSFNFYVSGRSINVISYNKIYPAIESVVLGSFHCNGANSFEFFVIF